MRLRDILSGRKKLQAEDDRLFALTTAAVTLQVELGLKCARRGGDHVQAAVLGRARGAFDDVDKLLDAVARQSARRSSASRDDYGYDWIVVHDPQLEDLVGTARTLAAELTAQGFGEQLLAAIFKFDGGANPVYWIYGFKRGAFWPFVPSGKDTRDNATELELKAKLEHELPIEPDLTRWLALFDAPL